MKQDTKKLAGKVAVVTGASKGIGASIAKQFHRQFNLNVLGLILTTQEAAKQFGSSGSVINIGSLAGTSPVPGASVYCATKAAVDAVTKSLARELGPRKIRVNSLNPGMI